MTHFKAHRHSEEYSYKHTEKSIGLNAGVELNHPIRVFSLEQLDVDRSQLIPLLTKNIDDLQWDFYDVRKAQLNHLKKHVQEQREAIHAITEEYYLGNSSIEVLSPFIEQLSDEQLDAFHKIKPHRRRSICQFIVSKTETSWKIERIYEKDFSQDVEDYRLSGRVFAQTNESYTEHPEFQKLIAGLANMTQEFRPNATEIKIVAHEMAVVTEKGVPGDNSPEGVHQDGSEFIVSALVLERKGILGGKSLIFGPDKKSMYFDYILQEGEGLFQQDKGTDYWHKVNSIYLDPASNIVRGERNILGFDIDVIK